MNLDKVLAFYFYNDRADVYRQTGKRQFELVYEDIQCHLAQYGKELSAHRDDISQQVTTDLRLNYPPEYHIQDNDLVKVYRAGEVHQLIAGNEFRYPTHNCCSLRRRKLAVQL